MMRTATLSATTLVLLTADALAQTTTTQRMTVTAPTALSPPVMALCQCRRD